MARKRAAHALAAAPKSFASAAGAPSSKPVLKIVLSAPLMVINQRFESHKNSNCDTAPLAKDNI